MPSFYLSTFLTPPLLLPFFSVAVEKKSCLEGNIIHRKFSRNKERETQEVFFFKKKERLFFIIIIIIIMVYVLYVFFYLAVCG